MKAVIQFPPFPFGSVSVGRRIQDQPLVCVSPAYFPFYKPEGIFQDPADPVHAAQFHVFPAPGDHLPHRIQMDHFGPGCTGCQRCCPCIGKQVKHLGYRLRGLLTDFLHPVVYIIPIGRLFGKNPHVLEGCQSQS